MTDYNLVVLQLKNKHIYIVSRVPGLLKIIQMVVKDHWSNQFIFTNIWTNVSLQCFITGNYNNFLFSLSLFFTFTCVKKFNCFFYQRFFWLKYPSSSGLSTEWQPPLTCSDMRWAQAVSAGTLLPCTNHDAPRSRRKCPTLGGQVLR